MKNKLKKMACILTACFVLALSFFVVPSFASSMPLTWDEVEELTSPTYYTVELDEGQTATPYSGTLYFTTAYCAMSFEPQFLEPGTYVAYGTAVPSAISNGSDAPLSGVILDNLVPSGSDYEDVFEYYEFGEPFEVTDATFMVWVQSYNELPVIQPYVEEPSAPLYDSAYDFFSDILYGGADNLTGAQELTMTIIATFAAISVIAAPFLLCYWIFFRGVRF